VLGLRAKLNDMQAAAVQSDSLGRLLADSERAKAALEMDVSQLLRDRSELQDRHAALQAQARQAEGKDRTIRDLQQQVEQQSVRSLSLRSCHCLPASVAPCRQPTLFVCLAPTRRQRGSVRARALSLSQSLLSSLSFSSCPSGVLGLHYARGIAGRAHARKGTDDGGRMQEQLDALVTELGHGHAMGGLQGEEEAELRRQISELRAANARLQADRVDADKVFEQELQRLRQDAGDDDRAELRLQVGRLQAALELQQKSLARSSVEGQRDKDLVIAQLQAQLQGLKTTQQTAALLGMVHAAAPPLSPDSLGTITLVESDVDGSGKASGGGSVTQEAQSHQGHAPPSSRERELEEQLAEAHAREHTVRRQLVRLEGIHKSAQGTALAQEQQLHQAVRVMGRTSQTLEQTTAGLSLEVEQWRAKAEAASKDASHYKAKADEAVAHLTQYDAAVVGLEKELAECKAALHLYHDRIVALAGAEDKVVQEHSKWRQQDDKSLLPLSTHLKATNKLAQEYAAERRHLQRSIAISVRACAPCPCLTLVSVHACVYACACICLCVYMPVRVPVYASAYAEAYVCMRRHMRRHRPRHMAQLGTSPHAHQSLVCGRTGACNTEA